MDKLVRRWKQTGLYETLQQVKDVYCEPKRNDEQLTQLMKDFGTSAKSQGALMLCIYRGKMSEGIDFADEKARAVICVGIPFPGVRDPKVTSKKSYNDEYSRTKNLLNGGEWFEVQAFRALNQALGRCIRHRHDYGAIILLDQRFSGQRYIKNLPKWIRHRLKTFNMNEAACELERFITHASTHYKRDIDPIEPVQASSQCEHAPLIKKEIKEALNNSDHPIILDDSDDTVHTEDPASSIRTHVVKDLNTSLLSVNLSKVFAVNLVSTDTPSFF